jgi:hypothetical protein
MAARRESRIPNRCCRQAGPDAHAAMLRGRAGEPGLATPPTKQMTLRQAALHDAVCFRRSAERDTYLMPRNQEYSSDPVTRRHMHFGRECVR